jgi:hypothetical protein
MADYLRERGTRTRERRGGTSETRAKERRNHLFPLVNPSPAHQFTDQLARDRTRRHQTKDMEIKGGIVAHVRHFEGYYPRGY